MFGTWRPGRFPPIITMVAKLVLMGDMAVRGADYAFGDSEYTARRLSEVESAAPLHWWGLAFILAAGIGFTGIILLRATPILWAHIAGTALYSALALGLIIDVVHQVGDPWFGAVPALALLAIALVLLWRSRKSNDRESPLMPLSALAATVSIAVLTSGLDGLRSATLLAGMAVLHLLMALGTAARARQATLREARTCE